MRCPSVRTYFLAAALSAVSALASTSGAAQNASTKPAVASQAQAQNVILIMTDGFRWQEIFRGAEERLMSKENGVGDTIQLKKDFWRDTPEARRKVLLPFLWGTIAREGQIFGNQDSGSVAHVTNGLKFSYPGYNETFSGRADSRIDSNEHGPNENTTVFEYLNNQPGFKGRVAAFATWAAFTRIINADRSGVVVRDGWDRGAPPTTTARAKVLRDMFATNTRYWGDNNWDALTHQSALDYIAVKKPRVLFIGYGETDEWAHGGRYDFYLKSVQQVDAYLAELWRTFQADPQYRNNTTMIITTDHGRGSGPRDWRDHGEKVVGAENIWMAVIGPGTAARGMRTNISPVTQSQVAATIATLLGKDFQSSAAGIAAPLADVLRSNAVKRN